MLDILKVGKEVQREEERDVVSSGGSWDTGVYPVVVEAAFLDKSKRGALMATAIFRDKDNRKITLNECIMSNKSGELKATYEKDGKPQLLPGYSKFLSLFHALGITNEDGKLVSDLSEVEIEEKVLKLYDFEEKKEVPQEKNCLVQLHDQQLEIVVYKEVVDKQKNVAGEGEKPKYENTGETREQNDVMKFLTEDGLTNLEVQAGAEEPKFRTEWLEAHEGKVKNKAKGAAEGGAKSGKPASKKKNLKFD